MAFRKKTDTGSGEVFRFENVGDTLTGVYLGSVDHEGDYAPTKKHLFRTEEGIKVVFGQTHLMQLLSGENPGTLVRVTYEEKKKLKTGTMKMYGLEIDPEYKASESDLAAAAQSTASNHDDDYEDGEEEAPEEATYTPPAKAAPAGKSPTASKVDAVNAVLAKVKRSA